MSEARVIADTETKADTGTKTLKIIRSDSGAWVGLWDDLLVQTAYQPIFRFTGGRLVPVACEALVRVSRGAVPVLADAFFGALSAEERSALEPGLRKLHVRNVFHIPAAQRRLFLNFDPSVLAKPGVIEGELRELGDELRAAGMSPADVVCEITEAEASDTEALKHFVYELRARGYVIAVDDFGAKAARMSRVRTVAPDIVKVDRKLAHRLMETPAGFGTLQLMVNRFRKDGIDTLVEGLESLWQVELAEKAGASMVQGYMTAAPRTVSPELHDWMMQFQPPRRDDGEPLVKRFQ